MVLSGAGFGSKSLSHFAFSIRFCMIQSPPWVAFLKKWIPIPPSILLCFTTIDSTSSQNGDTGTPASRPKRSVGGSGNKKLRLEVCEFWVV